MEMSVVTVDICHDRLTNIIKTFQCGFRKAILLICPGSVLIKSSNRSVVRTLLFLEDAMDTIWIEKITATETEKTEISNWIKRTGLDRFKRIYDIARNNKEEIEYYRLTECAKYDARIARWFFKTIRVVEGHMRAMILNHSNCYDDVINIRNDIKEFEKTIFQIILPNSSYRDVGIRWEEVCARIKRDNVKEIAMTRLLDMLSFAELVRLHSLLSDEKMYEGCIFKGRKKKFDDLSIINKLRNQIAHNHIILDYVLNSKGRIITLKDQIKLLLSYIEDKDMVSRRVNELNGYATYTRDGILMEIPEHYRIITEER